MTMRCSRPSFRRKQESRLPAPPGLWMPDHVRHDENVPVRLQLILNRSSEAGGMWSGLRVVF